MSQSDSLVNHPRLTQAWSHPEHDIGIITWKDIKFMSKSEQLRFWSCLAYLFIMPPKYLDNKKQPLWVCQTNARDNRGRNKSYVPMCRYDQFISSHATCCQHHTNYFSHYHRNLISQYLLALNQADLALREQQSQIAIVLKNKMKDQGLQKQYSSAIKFYNEKVMMDVKKELIQDGYALQQLPWVTPAYWNIFNYEQKIQLPKFLTSNKPKTGQNPILDLFKAYRKFEFAQYNFKETWNQGTQDLSYFWRARYTRFAPWEKKIIQGNSSRRQYLTYRNQIRSRIIQHGYGKFVQKLYEKDGEGKRKCTSDLIVLNDDQINFQYGGGQNLRYFSQAQTQNTQTIQSANFSIPYYQYARALLTPFQNFCIPSDSNLSMNRDGFLAGNNSISLPHDLMHDSLGYPSSDASFSIMSPMFMLYHGFVQYMHQQYLRLVEKYDKQKQAYKSLKLFLDTPIAVQNYRYNQEQRTQLTEIRNQIKLARMNNNLHQQRRRREQFKMLKRRIKMTAPQKKYLQPGFGGFLAEFQQQNQDLFKTNGDYPIFQWTLTGPDYDQFNLNQQLLIEGIHYSALGTYRELMLNDKQNDIRYSTNLYSFYKRHVQQMKVPQQLLDQGYPFSYTFDLIETNSTKDPPIPDYLYRIQADIQQGSMQAQLHAALRSKVGSDRPMPEVEPQKFKQIKSGMKFVFRDSISKKLGPSKVNQDVQQLKYEQLESLGQMKLQRKRFLEKLEQYTGLYCRIQHKSNIDNVTIMLSMKIKNTQTFQFSNTGSISQNNNNMKNKILKSNGLIGSYPYTVFGKGSLSSTCPRCKPIKSQKFNLVKYLTGQLNLILIDLHVNANIGVLYDSRYQNQSMIKQLRGKQKKFQDIVEVFHDYPNDNFKIQIISGAIQTNFHIIFCQDLQNPETKLTENSDIKHQIRIIAESIDLNQKKMFASLQAKRKSLNTEIVFQEMTAPIQKNKFMKQLVYKKFKVMLIVDYKKKMKEQKIDKIRKSKNQSRDKSRVGDIKIINFQFQIQNFAIQAYYDIRINPDYEVLVIDSNFNEKNDIFF